jgi:hypothetical protein
MTLAGRDVCVHEAGAIQLETRPTQLGSEAIVRLSRTMTTKRARGISIQGPGPRSSAAVSILDNADEATTCAHMSEVLGRDG